MMSKKKDVFSTLKEKWDFAIALIVICIFGALIYYFTAGTAAQETGEIAGASPDSELVVQSDSIKNPLLKNTEAISSNDERGAYQPTKVKIEDAYSNQVSEAVVLTDFIISKKVDSSKVNTTKQSEKIQLSTVQEPVTIKIDTVATSLKLTEPEHNSAKEVPEEEVLNCTVVVGVFNIEENKNAIIERLKEMGYRYDDGILREGMSFVGVPVACSDNQKKTQLVAELNKAFGIDAWVKQK